MTDPHGSGVLWRLGNAEKRLDAMAQVSNDLPVIRRDVQALREDLREARDELKTVGERVDKLTLAVLGAVLTLAVFALGIAITLFTTGVGST